MAKSRSFGRSNKEFDKTIKARYNQITVTGCQYTWVLSSTKKNGTLTLYNATGNITVTIIATAVSSYGQTPTYDGLWNLFGDNNFRGEKNSVNVFDDVGFMDDFIYNYSKISGGATS